MRYGHVDSNAGITHVRSRTGQSDILQPLVKHKSSSASTVSKRYSLGKPVTVDFSPGETRILEELLNISDAHVVTDTRVQELMKQNKDLKNSLAKLQHEIRHFAEVGGQGPGGVADMPRQMDIDTSPSQAQLGMPLPTESSVKGSMERAVSLSAAPSELRPSAPSKQGSRRTLQLGEAPKVEQHDSPTAAALLNRQSSPSNLYCKDDEGNGPWHLLGSDWPASLAAKRLQALNSRRTSLTDTHAMVRGKTEDSMSSSALTGRKCRLRCVRRGAACCGRCVRMFVVNPNSWLRMSFDALSVLVLMWDLTVIPYLLAWGINSGPGTFWQLMSWCTASYWTLDIVVNCFTATVKEGKLVRDPHQIFEAYLRTWFLPDFFIIACDWVAMTLAVAQDSNQSGTLKMLRLAKIGRLLRIVGMLKVFKLARVAMEFLNRSVGESYRMAMKFISVIVCIIWMTHIISCGWFAVGRSAHSDTGLRWFDSSLFLDLDAEGLLFQYVITFNWSLSQVTLGASDVTAVNSVEKIYTICCLIFGLLFGSTLVSSLSATMVEFQMLRNGRKQKLRMLRQFLSDNAVDLDISYMVQKQVKERLGPSDRLTEKDVPVLQLLSSQLLAELRMEIHRVHLTKHALFSTWLGMDRPTFIALCSDLFFTFLRAEDQLFHPGEADEICFNLVKGPLFYVQSPDSSVAVDDQVENHVHAGAWLAEPAMWCYWRHVGTAEARGDCQVLVLPLEVVNFALQTRQVIRHVVQHYAEIYHKRITAARPPDRAYPTDLHVPLTDFEDIVMSMDKESQIAVGLVAMKHLKNNVHFGDAAGRHQKLRTEVEKGKSTVLMSSGGEVLRIVNLATVKVGNGRGQVFAQIGVFDADKADVGIKTECQLPGLKQDRQEEAQEAAKRCILEKLPALAHVIEVEATMRLTEYKPSKEYGVRTKYVKTICTATINESKFNLQSWLAANNLERYQIPLRPDLGNAAGDTATIAAWDIYPMAYGRKVFFYSWITEAELSHMTSPGGDAKVRQRLEAFQFNFEAFEFQAEQLGRQGSIGARLSAPAMIRGSVTEVTETSFTESTDPDGSSFRRGLGEQDAANTSSLLPATEEGDGDHRSSVSSVPHSNLLSSSFDFLHMPSRTSGGGPVQVQVVPPDPAVEGAAQPYCEGEGDPTPLPSPQAGMSSLRTDASAASDCVDFKLIPMLTSGAVKPGARAIQRRYIEQGL